jgi:hypothetical protein
MRITVAFALPRTARGVEDRHADVDVGRRLVQARGGRIRIQREGAVARPLERSDGAFGEFMQRSGDLSRDVGELCG